jgi:hypothetical protein
MAEVQLLRNGQYSVRVTGAEFEEIRQTFDEALASKNDEVDLSKLDEKTREIVRRALSTRWAARASIAEALRDTKINKDEPS